MSELLERIKVGLTFEYKELVSELEKVDKLQRKVDRLERRLAGRPTVKRYSLGLRTAKRVLQKTGGKCFYCSTDLPPDTEHRDDRGNLISAGRNWDIDHVVPISRGGTHAIDNLVPSCKQCNQSKGKKYLSEFVGVLP